MDHKAVLLGNYVAHVQSGKVLSREQAREAFMTILCNETTAADFYWGALFGAIQARGNNVEETLGLVDAVMAFDSSVTNDSSKKIRIDSKYPVVSCTGSGKEGFKTINVSTGAAIIASCANICVVKPGSISTSAVSGAVNVLQELEIYVPANLLEAKLFAEKVGICFVNFSSIASRYAKRYDKRFFHFHPLSYIMPPLAIPFALDGLVYGIADNNVLHCAQLLKAIGYGNAIAVSGMIDHQVIDEFSPFGASWLGCVQDDLIYQTMFEGIELCPAGLGHIAQKQSHQQNTSSLVDALAGLGPRAAIDLLCANAALLFKVGGCVKTLEEGVELAQNIVHRGQAMRKLDQCIDYSRQLTRRDMALAS
jgi:anthranilate phosphoribosyltransferase